MTYPDEYYDYKRRLSDALLEQKKLKQLLDDLNSDYETLQECKQKLSEGSGLLGYLVTQCDDINNAFDRGTIEGKYDACEIVFENKDSIFENLSNISTSTTTFSSSCEDVQSQIDEYGIIFDTKCTDDIAKEAQNVSISIEALDDKIFRLRSSIETIERMAP